MAKPRSGRTDNSAIIRELRVAYGMEIETIQNFIANSVHLEAVRSDVIRKALTADVPTELMHAQQQAQRIKIIGGRVPGSFSVMAVSRANRDALWAGTDEDNVWVSDDRGAAWTQADSPGVSYWVTDIAPDP